jgi:hypothetical protein
MISGDSGAIWRVVVVRNLRFDQRSKIAASDQHFRISNGIATNSVLYRSGLLITNSVQNLLLTSVIHRTFRYRPTYFVVSFKRQTAWYHAFIEILKGVLQDWLTKRIKPDANSGTSKSSEMSRGEDARSCQHVADEVDIESLLCVSSHFVVHCRSGQK